MAEARKKRVFKRYERELLVLTRPAMLAFYVFAALVLLEAVIVAVTGRPDDRILTALLTAASLIIGAALGVRVSLVEARKTPRKEGLPPVRPGEEEAEEELSIDELIRIGREKLEELLKRVRTAEDVAEYERLMKLIATFLRTNAALIQAREKVSGKAKAGLDLAQLLSSIKKFWRGVSGGGEV